MKKRNNNRGDCQARVPLERDHAPASEIQITDRGRKKHKAQSKDASVHDQGISQDGCQRKSVDHAIQRLSCLAWTGEWHRNRGRRPLCQK